MSPYVKAQVMLAILKLAPMGKSLEQFERYAEAGDLDSMWRYFENATQYRSDVGRSVEAVGKISFEVLRPALEAVYRIPESAGA